MELVPAPLASRLSLRETAIMELEMGFQRTADVGLPGRPATAFLTALPVSHPRLQGREIPVMGDPQATQATTVAIGPAVLRAADLQAVPRTAIETRTDIWRVKSPGQ